MAPLERPRRLVAVNHTGLVSGAEIVLLRLLSRAPLQGWEPFLVAPEGPLAKAADQAGISRAAIPDLTLPAGLRSRASAVLAMNHAAAARVVREAAAGAGLVVANGIRVLPTVRLMGARPPTVWLVHSVVDRRRWKVTMRLCSGAFDRAVAVSGVAARPLLKAGLPVGVEYNGTPWPVEPAPTDAPSPPVVGCSAILTSWKGQHVLLDAIGALGRSDVHVELMGATFPKDTAYATQLRERASRTDLAGRVRHLGHRPDPLAAMRGWAVCVVASVRADAGPLAAIEAMSLGVPVVATANSGAAEFLGDAGLLVPPGNPGAMAAAIVTLLDPKRRQSCAASGRRTVAEHFTLDGRTDSLLHTMSTFAARQPRMLRS